MENSRFCIHGGLLCLLYRALPLATAVTVDIDATTDHQTQWKCMFHYVGQSVAIYTSLVEGRVHHGNAFQLLPSCCCDDLIKVGLN